MPTNEDFSEINKRLGVMIALLLRSIPATGEKMSLHDQVDLLSELGMRPKDIAEILGRTPGYVTKELATIRKSKKKKVQ
jgi:hypothetical protein